MNTTKQPKGLALWRRRADEARRDAERLADPESKRTLLEIADAYERLAKQMSSQK